MKRVLILISILPALLAAGGCANLGIAERCRMQTFILKEDKTPTVDGLVDHVYYTREAASGGSSVSGGGCGCN